MAIICPKCGNEINSQVCPYCGAAIGATGPVFMVEDIGSKPTVPWVRPETEDAAAPVQEPGYIELPAMKAARVKTKRSALSVIGSILLIISTLLVLAAAAAVYFMPKAPEPFEPGLAQLREIGAAHGSLIYTAVCCGIFLLAAAAAVVLSLAARKSRAAALIMLVQIVLVAAAAAVFFISAAHAPGGISVYSAADIVKAGNGSPLFAASAILLFGWVVSCIPWAIAFILLLIGGGREKRSGKA